MDSEGTIPKNGLLLHAKLRTTKLTVKKMKLYEDMPKHNVKQWDMANDCWETIATGRPSWHVSNLRWGGSHVGSLPPSHKGRKLSCKQDGVCKHKTSILSLLQKGTALY